MLYLEDFIELIDVYPDISKERLAEMRILDLEIENAMADMRKARDGFFKRCPNMDDKSRSKEYNEIVTKVFGECLEKADDKVQIAVKLSDMLDRYLYKQKMELQKFKFELEADNAGVTELLERKVEEDFDKQQQMLRHQRMERKRNRRLASPDLTRNGTGLGLVNGVSDKKVKTESSSADEKPSGSYHQRLVVNDKHMNGVAPGPKRGGVVQGERDGSPYLRHVGGVGNNALAAAASQAIAATQQMQAGRRSASLKASYAAVAKGTAGFQNYFSSSNRSSATSNKSKREKKFPKLKLHKSSSTSSLSSFSKNSNGGRKFSNQTVLPSTYAGGAGKGLLVRMKIGGRSVPGNEYEYGNGDDDDDEEDGDDDEDEDVEDSTGGEDVKRPGPVRHSGPSRTSGEDGYGDHGDNQLYCKCRQVSYGDMIACDNPDCPIEWFHYECVHLTSAPKGKWFCPDCIISMKRRGVKK